LRVLCYDDSVGKPQVQEQGLGWLREIAKNYEPQQIEPRWADFWVREQLFRADSERRRDRVVFCGKFVISTPMSTGFAAHRNAARNFFPPHAVHDPWEIQSVVRASGGISTVMGCDVRNAMGGKKKKGREIGSAENNCRATQKDPPSAASICWVGEGFCDFGEHPRPAPERLVETLSCTQQRTRI